MLTPKQFIFVPNHSSYIQLLLILGSYLNNESIKVVYTDIQKTFDSVSHQKLIKSLTQYRFYDSLINWFREFLNKRTQKVIVNNELSNSLTIFSQVPQG